MVKKTALQRIRSNFEEKVIFADNEARKKKKRANHVSSSDVLIPLANSQLLTDSFLFSSQLALNAAK